LSHYQNQHFIYFKGILDISCPHSPLLNPLVIPIIPLVYTSFMPRITHSETRFFGPTAPAAVVATAVASAFHSSCLCVASAVDAVFGCDMHTQIAPIRRPALSATASCSCESSCTCRTASEWVLVEWWAWFSGYPFSESCSIV